jgi:hypothetical protein
MNDTNSFMDEFDPMPDATSSRRGIDPRQQLPAREVTGSIDPTLQPTQDQFSPVPGKPNAVLYRGQNLVDRNGVIVRPQYAGTYDEAYQLLAKYNPAERRGLLNTLYKIGAYEGGKPSNTGFDNRDFAAVARAMLWANPSGYELEAALPLMAAEIGTVMPSGPRIRTTAAQDLRAIFKQASQSVLGRNLSDSEVEKFVRAYQGMETREQTGGATAPSPQAAAIEQVEQQNRSEADAVGMMRLAEAFNQAIRGLG